MAPPKKPVSKLGRTARYYRRAQGLKIKGMKPVGMSHYDKRINQQTQYEMTPKGKALQTNAHKLRAKLGPKPGKHYDAAHYKGSTTEGRWQKSGKNRSRK